MLLCSKVPQFIQMDSNLSKPSARIDDSRLIRSVAVIGVGSMGAAIARLLQKAGYALTVCDVNEAALARFEKEGARVVRKPADCARCDLVIVLVTTAPQVQTVVMGDNGLHTGLRHDHQPVIAVMSTVPADLIRHLELGLQGLACSLMDAPISGGLRRAEQGTLTVMAGGDVAVIDAVRPVFANFASQVIRCGELGAGEKMKIVNNIVGNTNTFITAEAYRLASHFGLDIADTARALDAATGRNTFSADPEGLTETFAALVRDRASFDALLAVMRKDIAYAAQLAASEPGTYPTLDGIQAIMDTLGDETFDNWLFLADQGNGSQGRANDS